MRIKLTEGLVSVNTPGAAFPAVQPVNTGIAAPAGKKDKPEQTRQPFKYDFSSDQGPRLNLTPNIPSTTTSAGGVQSSSTGTPPTAPTTPAGGVQSSSTGTPSTAPAAPAGGIGLTRTLPSNMVPAQTGGFPPVSGGIQQQQQQPDGIGIGPITAPVASGFLSSPGFAPPLMTSTGEVNQQALSTSPSAGAVAPSTTTTFRPSAPTEFTPSGAASVAKPQTGASLTQVASGTATPTQLAMIGVGAEKIKPESESKEQPMDAAVDEFKKNQSQQSQKTSFEDRKKLRKAQGDEREAEEELKHARFLRKQQRSRERFDAMSERNVASRKHTRSMTSPIQEKYKFKRGDLKMMLSENVWDSIKNYAGNVGSVAAIPPQLLPAYSMGLVAHMGASRAASDIWKKHYADAFRSGVSDISALAGLGASKLAPYLQKIPGVSKGLGKLSKIASAVPYLGVLGKRALNYGKKTADGGAEAFGVLAKRALFNPTTTDEYQIGDDYNSAVGRMYRNY